MNRTISIEYPEYLANSLRLETKDFKNEIKTSSLIKLFELGRVSSGTAAKVLGITRVDFLDLLAKYNVSVFCESDLREDVINA